MRLTLFSITKFLLQFERYKTYDIGTGSQSLRSTLCARQIRTSHHRLWLARLCANILSHSNRGCCAILQGKPIKFIETNVGEKKDSKERKKNEGIGIWKRYGCTYENGTTRPIKQLKVDYVTVWKPSTQICNALGQYFAEWNFPIYMLLKNVQYSKLHLA